jgi:CO/xanthine dehydrogenase Mo-binding subunit
MAYTLIGKNFTPPDVRAKVTGTARYSEDFRPDGMLFCKLLTSPMPHARVVNIDASEALAMPGVAGILTADEVTPTPEPQDGILTNEPVFVGQPILAIAADTEAIAADALEAIKIQYEELPFTVDPLESLYPGGKNARTDGNIVMMGQLSELKWTAQDFAAASEGQLPMGKAATEWSYGDIDAGFAAASVVLDETFVTQGIAHHSMEPRTAMAYWQNGKCHLHASSQSGTFPIPTVARYIGIEPDQLVFIAEYCGGGFGSKGGGYPIVAVPALLSKKLNNRPVMMRIARHEEYAIGSARHGFQGRIKMGFRPDGRVAAVDLYIVQENGPNAGFSDWLSAADAIALVYTPQAMRFRGVPVLTNTPPRGPQRGPGQNQIAGAIEPLIDKAARALKLDRVAIRRINAPNNDSKYGAQQGTVTSAYLSDALAQGATAFDWEQRKARSAQRNGSKVTGIGVGTAYHSAGGRGFDGLVGETPDGTHTIHTRV